MRLLKELVEALNCCLLEKYTTGQRSDTASATVTALVFVSKTQARKQREQNTTMDEQARSVPH